MIDRRPAVIVRPVDADDVRRAVVFARENHIPVSVKGGGHNVAGSAVGAGGLMLDCSSMRAARIDAVRQVAQVEAGALLADLDGATQVYGLATPLGVVSVTGVGGLTLGGGIGWLSGRHGLACDNLISAEIVTSEGDLLTASPDEHADLYWAIRGGGGNFGVVTAFTYRLHPVGRVLAGAISFPAERTREVLQFYPAFAASCPDDLSMSGSLSLDGLGRPVFGVGVCWCGIGDDVDAALAPLRDFGPVSDEVASMDYDVWQEPTIGAFHLASTTIGNLALSPIFPKTPLTSCSNTQLNCRHRILASGCSKCTGRPLGCRPMPRRSGIAGLRTNCSSCLNGVTRPRPSRMSPGPATSSSRCSRSRQAGFMSTTWAKKGRIG